MTAIFLPVVIVVSMLVAGNLGTQNNPWLWVLLVVNAILLGFAPAGIADTFEDRY